MAEPPGGERDVGFCLAKLEDAETSLCAVRHALHLLAGMRPEENGHSVTKSNSLANPNFSVPYPTIPIAVPAMPNPRHSWKAFESTASAASWQAVDQVLVDTLTEDVPIEHREDHVEVSKQMTNDILWVQLVGSLRIAMIHPEAKFRIGWVSVGFVFIVYEAYSIPYKLAFDAKDSVFWMVIGFIVNIYFLFDVLLTFVTGSMEEEGFIEFCPKKVARKYVLSWFVPDLMSAVPWEWLPLGSAVQPLKGMRFIRAFRLLRLTRLVHMIKLGAVLEKVETVAESNQICMFSLGLTKILLGIFGVCHWAACAWYLVGHSGQSLYPTNWLTEITARQGLDSLGEPIPTPTMYIYCLYFTLTTMTTVGYGDITPMNFQETLFGLFLLLLASIVFAGQMGALTELITSIQHHNHLKREKKMSLSRYMRWRGVPRKLMVSIRQHLIFLWDTNEGNDAYEEELKMLLPPVLKTELCYHIYGGILGSAPFLSWMRDYAICIKQLASMVQTMFLERGDNIFHCGQPNDTIYMLLTGKVWLSRNENLFEGVDQTVLQPLALGGMMIPRKQEGSILALAGQVVKKKQATMKQCSQNGAKNVAKKFGSSASTEHLGETESAATPTRFNSKPKMPENNVFNSQILQTASMKLLLQDRREQHAALVVQRQWKRKLKMARDMDSNGFSTMSSVKTKGSRSIAAMASKQIKAPCYFGESCLWVPYEDWDTELPPAYMYSARCMNRCEFVYVKREYIALIFQRFSPWLESRFDFFRKDVLNNLEPYVNPHTEGLDPSATKASNLGGDGGNSLSRQGSRQSAWRRAGPNGLPVDWAIADIMLPQDDPQRDHPLAEGGGHRQILRRAAAEAAALGPALPRSLSRGDKMLKDGLRLEPLHPGQRHQAEVLLGSGCSGVASARKAQSAARPPPSQPGCCVDVSQRQPEHVVPTTQQAKRISGQYSEATGSTEATTLRVGAFAST